MEMRGRSSWVEEWSGGMKEIGPDAIINVIIYFQIYY
jgi:hypothetical protein